MKSISLIYTVLLALVYGIVATARVLSNDHYFNVRDSIAMSHFSMVGQTEVFGFNWEPYITFSPDHRHVAVVTTRGILQSNMLESTIWVFSTAEIRAFLHAPNGVPAPKPRIAARITVVPRYDAQWAYMPVIGKLQWLDDSKGIVFESEDTSGAHRLYRCNLPSGAVRPLTPAGYDVTNFAIARDTVVYVGATLQNAKPLGVPINAYATDVTGVPAIYDILFPETPGWFREEHHKVSLWVLDKSDHARRIIVAGSASAEFDGSVLAMLPGGHTIVTLVPAKRIPASWKYFVGRYPGSRIDLRSPGNVEEFGLVNIGTGKVTALLQAPTTVTLDLLNRPDAIVSPNGRSIVLSSVFLPHHRYPCLAAVVDIASKATTCAVFSLGDYVQGSPHSNRRLWLADVAFGPTARDLVLTMFNSSFAYLDYHYHDKGAKWVLVKHVTAGSVSGGDAFSISVKEDLNTPPALWATDAATTVSKQVWDPNPQLVGMNFGKASVFHWQGTTGYQYRGGLVLPPDYVVGRRYPLVIQAHGFDSQHFMADGAFPTAFAERPLASVGIIVLQMDDSPGNDGITPRELPDQIREYSSAVTRLAEMGLVDPKRAGIIGFSRTSWYAEGALVASPQLFAAASITDGVDEGYWWYMLFGGLNHEAEQIYGTAPFGKGLETWVRDTPAFNLDRVRTPLLITAFSPGGLLTEWQIYNSLRMQHKPVEFIYFPQRGGYNHILRRPMERLTSQQTNVDWFRFWLQSYEDPNPAKAAQYRRWEQLRKLQKP